MIDLGTILKLHAAPLQRVQFRSLRPFYILKIVLGLHRRFIPPLPASVQVTEEAQRRQAEREAAMRSPSPPPAELRSGGEPSTSSKAETTPRSLARGVSKLWRTKMDASGGEPSPEIRPPGTPEHAAAQTEELGSEVDDLRAQVREPIVGECGIRLCFYCHKEQRQVSTSFCFSILGSPVATVKISLRGWQHSQ